MTEPARLLYRHLVVKRKTPLVLSAPPELIRKAIRQEREIQNGVRTELDPDVVRLHKQQFLQKTMRQTYGKGYSDQQLDSMAAGFKQGGAIVVGTLNKSHIPGGAEPLPANATFWTLPVDYEGRDPHDAFMESAIALQERFAKKSDTMVALLPEETRAGVTLVTVAYSPIIAYPLATRGFEVGMEFHQKTRWGFVPSDEFEVVSYDGGLYPIKAPSKESMMVLMKSAADLDLDKGFLTEEQREANDLMKKANIAKRPLGPASVK